MGDSSQSSNDRIYSVSSIQRTSTVALTHVSEMLDAFTKRERKNVCERLKKEHNILVPASDFKAVEVEIREQLGICLFLAAYAGPNAGVATDFLPEVTAVVSQLLPVKIERNGLRIKYRIGSGLAFVSAELRTVLLTKLEVEDVKLESKLAGLQREEARDLLFSTVLAYHEGRPASGSFGASSTLNLEDQGNAGVLESRCTLVDGKVTVYAPTTITVAVYKAAALIGIQGVGESLYKAGFGIALQRGDGSPYSTFAKSS